MQDVRDHEADNAVGHEPFELVRLDCVEVVQKINESVEIFDDSAEFLRTDDSKSELLQLAFEVIFQVQTKTHEEEIKREFDEYVYRCFVLLR